MAWIGETWRRLRFLAHRSRHDRDLDEEMQFHLEMRAEEQRAAGVAAVEAGHAASRRFGSRTLVAEEAREASGWPFIESVVRDVRLGLRSLGRSPAFVAVALVSLALGIGVNATIFTVTDKLFLSPIPAVKNSGGLVAVYYQGRRGADDFDSVSYPGFEYIRSTNRSFTDLLAYSAWGVTVRMPDGSDEVTGELVSPNYFTVLGVQPAAGRTFLPTEGQTPNADPVVVVAYDYWQQYLGGSRSIVGRPIQIGDAMFTIIGVAPRGFQGLSVEKNPPVLWLLASMSRRVVPGLEDITLQWGNHSFDMIGRLRPGVRNAGATVDLTNVATRMAADHPESGPTSTAAGAAYSPVLFPAIQSRFWVGRRAEIVSFLALLATIGVLVFLVACFNVASLVLARATRRQHELALQLSLGASRGRLVRQLLTENLLLSLAAAAAALVAARWSAAALSWFGQALGTGMRIDTAIDARILAFTAIVAVVCTLILTILPARLASRASLTSVMTGTVGAGTSSRPARAQQILVAAQVSVSVVLLVGASLFVRTLQNARAVDPTVRPQDVLVGRMNLKAANYDAVRGSGVYSEILSRVRSLAGVRDAAFVFVVPLGGRRGGTDIVLEGAEQKRPVPVGFNVVTPGYFSTVGLTVVAGRNFQESDRSGTAPVAVINEIMAGRVFRGRNPVGQRFLLRWRPFTTVEVVGVVRDGRFRNYRAEMESTMYVPLAQRYQPDMTLEVRANGNLGAVLSAVRHEIAAIDKNVPLTNVSTLRARFDATLAQERLIASLLSALGLLALLLAAVGLYGLLSYTVAQRTRELGIRVALGARPTRIIRMVVGRVILLVAVGLGIGTTSALLLAPLVRRLLFGVEPADPRSFATSIAVLSVTAAIAAWLPARRAAKADPWVALRHE